ncbi:MAG: methylenetetrahydrofolate reductase [Thermoplasmatales archaeon]|nr:methylenetetrahydrofolate reductase [Thermoplasmatales archaeon]
MEDMKSGSNLEKVLAKGDFAVTAEIGPPKGSDPNVIKRKGELLRGYADAFNVTDNQTAVTRMSSMAACAILQEMGLETVMQMTCRDRNRIALQSDVLGASAIGIKNILCLTGDHQSFGNHPSAKGVYDIDSVQLIQTLKIMREGRFLSGDRILSGANKIFIGAAANPYAEAYAGICRLEKKIRAGAEFIQTQSIFSIDGFEEWMKEVRSKNLHKKVHILAGITPLKSIVMAEHMKNRVPGTFIPEEVIVRMKNAKDPKKEGCKIALEVIEEVKNIDGVHGIHITAVFWEEIIPFLVKESGFLPRPKC